MKIKTWQIITAVVVLGGAYMYYKAQNPQPIEYITEKIEKRDITQVLSVTGSVEPLKRVQILAETSEKITEILKKEGDTVEKGEILMKLDAQRLDLAVKEANASLLQAQASLKLAKTPARNADINIQNQNIAAATQEKQNAEQNLNNIEAQNQQNVKTAKITAEEAQKEIELAQSSAQRTQKDGQESIKRSQENLEELKKQARVPFYGILLGIKDALRDANTILKEESEVNRVDLYPNSEFGEREKLLKNRVKANYRAVENAYQLFKEINIPKTEPWGENASPESAINALNPLFRATEGLLNGTISIIDATEPSFTTNATLINTARQTITSSLTNLRNQYQSGLNSVQAIENAQNEIQRVTLSAQIANQNAQDNIVRAKIRLENAQNSVQTAQTNANSSTIQGKQAISNAQIRINQAKAQKNSVQNTFRAVDLLSPQAQVAAAEARLLQAKLNAQNGGITAPISGIITQIYPETGSFVATGERVAEIISQEMEIIANIAESDIGQIQIGQKARTTFDAFTKNDEINAEISRIATGETIEQGVIYYEVGFTFKKGDLSIKPSMTADLDVILAEKNNVLAMDRLGITQKDDGFIVEILNETTNEPEERKIQTGIEGDVYFEIKEGITEGEIIILGEKEE